LRNVVVAAALRKQFEYLDLALRESQDADRTIVFFKACRRGSVAKAPAEPDADASEQCGKQNNVDLGGKQPKRVLIFQPLQYECAQCQSDPVKYCSFFISGGS
jgi:hypothetical protein